MVIVVVECGENARKLDCCCKDHQNMKYLMGAAKYIELARLK
jgi:hypothetical protein